VLEVRNASFGYPENPEVLCGVSFSVARGARLGIMGENGSGKTTLAHLMCGLLRPAAGDVVVDGVSTGFAPSLHEIRRRVGIVFQDPDDQLIEATVEREIGFGLRNLGLGQAEIRHEVDRALTVFGIEHLKPRPCHLLSAGEKQMVTVASIFAMQPDYVILDESTSLLDYGSRLRLLAAVELLLAETGAGLVLISMRLEDVWMCDRVLLLKAGSIDFDGGRAGLAARLAERRVPLSGLAYILSRMNRSLPGFAERIACSASLSATSISEILAEMADGPKGGAGCR
jgi:energy-coupling factor transport system ATP-binding protein